MSKRSVWKGPYVDPGLIRKLNKIRDDDKKIVMTRSRRSAILPAFVGRVFGVYNGRKHIPVSVTEEMVGHKLGEFSPTRTFYEHASDKKGKKK